MIALAIAFLALGSAGEIAAVIMEIHKHEKIYSILMKVFPWVFALGAVILGICL